MGMVERGGQVVVRMLKDVKQKTIEPIIKQMVSRDSRVYTDEYKIYNHLENWGFTHLRVNHSTGEYARDDDRDGLHEVHVNTNEGFWSLLRSWLRPHQGVSQEKLSLYPGFFEVIHNARARGKALLPSLLEVLLAP